MAVLVTGTACASANTPPVDRFERLRLQDLRVASVAYRLSIANAAFCGGVLTPQFGFVLHSIEQYGKADRAAAERRFGLGQGVGVMAVVSESPAAQAGLSPGDHLVSVNGRAFPENAANDDPNRRAVDAAEAMLREEMRHGPVTLRLSLAGGLRDLRLTADRGCPSVVELIPGASVNAWADGSRVIIEEGLLARCETDADLALVIGHEIAHNLLHHRARLSSEGVVANGLLPMNAAASRQVRETEEEADRLAVTLARTARYDLSGAEVFLRRLLDTGQSADTTHPAPKRRLALLHAAIADQRAGSAAGREPIGKTASIGFFSGRM